tara:strand:+ start:2442 stop:2762 length:321 start_codon:yes stop_codon:yes gene_type:complete
MGRIAELQDEVGQWSHLNFGTVPSWQCVLGLQEELGELSHHYLKREQRIRSAENHDAEIADAVGDIFVFLLHFCHLEGISLEDTIEAVWAAVEQRDWTKNRVDGTA